MDMVKQRLQMGEGTYKGVWDCVKRVLREEGIGAFYASYRTTVLMNAPFTAVHFATYEAAKKGLIEFSPERVSDEEGWLVHATAGAAAGGLAAARTSKGMAPENALPCSCSSNLLNIRIFDISDDMGIFNMGLYISIYGSGNPSQPSVTQLHRLFQFNLRHNAFPSQTVAAAAASLASPGHRSFYGSINENAESEEETETETEREEIRRAFEEDERRRRSPLVAENAVRVMEAMRAISFPGTAPDWASDVNEDRWIDQLRRLRSTSQ
ncbi:unnamed protein product [Arabidopsis halleri]